MPAKGQCRTMSTTDARPPQHPIANTEQAAAWNGPQGANWTRASAGTVDHGLEPFLRDDGVRSPGAHWLVTAERGPGVDG